MSPKDLPNNVDEKQLISAKTMQYTSIWILLMIFVSFLFGVYSEYDQNVYLYGIFTILNGFLGFIIFVMHSISNQTVREVLIKAWNRVIRKK